MSEAVFFDLWNTLLECPTRGKIEEVVKLLGLEEKTDYHSVLESMYETLFVDPAYGEERFFRELCGTHGRICSEEEVRAAAVVWDSRLGESRFFPETEMILQDLRRDYELGLISNIDACGAEYARANFLKDYFNAVVMSCDVGRVKPDPMMYEIA